jgi:hypothetical protein
MEFVLVGFGDERSIRRFVFEGIATDRTRKQFSVTVDLSTLRKHQIAIQELPLLCRRLLERESVVNPSHAFEYSEQLMRDHQDQCLAAKREADLKKRAPRRPAPSLATGQAWRTGIGQIPPATPVGSVKK